jgi:uncharacterized membrane protein YphA (DoxX/SURF4 family)
MNCPTSPKCIGKLILRVSFGGSLALVGLVHYMTLHGTGDMPGFVDMVSMDLGPLTPLGTAWAYILPGLQIVGGVLIVLKYRPDIATWAAGIALASIAIGMLLKPVLTGADLGMSMGAVNNTMLWLLVYIMVVKCCLCCGKCETGSGGMEGGHM